MIGGFIEAIVRIISPSLIRYSTPYCSQIVGHFGQYSGQHSHENSQLINAQK